MSPLSPWKRYFRRGVSGPTTNTFLRGPEVPPSRLPSPAPPASPRLPCPAPGRADREGVAASPFVVRRRAGGFAGTGDGERTGHHRDPGGGGGGGAGLPTACCGGGGGGGSIPQGGARGVRRGRDGEGGVGAWAGGREGPGAPGSRRRGAGWRLGSGVAARRRPLPPFVPRRAGGRLCARALPGPPPPLRGPGSARPRGRACAGPAGRRGAQCSSMCRWLPDLKRNEPAARCGGEPAAAPFPHSHVCPRILCLLGRRGRGKVIPSRKTHGSARHLGRI